MSSIYQHMEIVVSFSMNNKPHFALMLHKDGFSTTKINLKICWVVNLVILNAGKTDSIGPKHVVFIPSSSDKLIKHADCNILTCFLVPLVRDLEIIFVEGFPVIYA